MKAKHLLASTIVIILAILLNTVVAAQEATPSASIELTGTISTLESDSLTVNGLKIDIAQATITGELSVGINVQIVATLNPDGSIVAQTVTVVVVIPTPALTETPLSNPTQSPTDATATPVGSSDGDLIIVIEGPVANININIITIYNINIEVDVNNPILNIIQIGDVIYVEGVMNNSGVIVASIINNLAEAETVAEGASVGIQGPIEAINGNLITVNGITVQLDPNDPQLQTLVVGNFLDIQGNFVFINNVYILIVVNIIIINDINPEVPGYCWWHEDGMGMGMGMGHWHCDGMGMGGMGMGN